MSLERLLAALEAEKIELPIEKKVDCYLVSLGEEAKDYTVGLLYELRQAGFSAERDYLDRKVKAQFKAADRLGAKYVVVIGEDELQNNKINVKHLETGQQKEIELTNLVSVLKDFGAF